MAETKKQTEEESAKLLAEAEKVRVETEKLHVEVEKMKAELAFTQKQQEILLREDQASADEAEHNAALALVARHAAERDELVRLSNDIYHHIFRFTDEVNSASVTRCMNQLSMWDRTEPDCDIEIMFSSPGGSVIAGNVLFDFIMDLRERHNVTTSTMGMAASMAGILLQAGDRRVMHKRAWVLIHEISAIAVGKIGEMEDEIAFIKRLQEKALEIFAERCSMAHKNGTAKHPLTKGQMANRWKRKDWWVSAEECLDFGLVDELRG